MDEIGNVGATSLDRRTSQTPNENARARPFRPENIARLLRVRGGNYKSRRPYRPKQRLSDMVAPCWWAAIFLRLALADFGGYVWDYGLATRPLISRPTPHKVGSSSTIGSATRGQSCSRTRRRSPRFARPNWATWRA